MQRGAVRYQEKLIEWLDSLLYLVLLEKGVFFGIKKNCSYKKEEWGVNS